MRRDPSSQSACTIGGNIAMNSGRAAHCLNTASRPSNLLGARLVTYDGEILDIGGASMDAAGYDLIGLACGSEGQLGIVTEATVRLIPLAEGARPVLFGFDLVADASQCVAAIIAAGIVPVAMEYLDKPAIHICENFAHAGYPLDVEAMLIIEVEGADPEMRAMLARIGAIAKAHNVRTARESMSAMESAQIRKGRKSAFGATGRVADYICMDGTVPTGQLPEALKRTASMRRLRASRRQRVSRRRRRYAVRWSSTTSTTPEEGVKAEAAGAAILEMCVDLGGCLTGEHGVGIEVRELMPRQFTDIELAQQKRVRAVFDPDGRLESGQGLPAGRTGRMSEALARRARSRSGRRDPRGARRRVEARYRRRRDEGGPWAPAHGRPQAVERGDVGSLFSTRPRK